MAPATLVVEKPRRRLQDIEHRNIVEDLKTTLVDQGVDLDGRHAIDSYIHDHDACRMPKPINHIPPAAQARYDDVVAAAGLSASYDYNKLALLTLIDRFEKRADACGLPSWLRDDARNLIGKIRKTAERSRTSKYYRLSHWNFQSDLAVCRLKQWPCGVELIDVCSAVARKWLVRDGVAQTVKRAHYFTFRTGGTRTFFETHFDVRLAREFSLDGYQKLYRRVARLLETAPSIKGVFSRSWWHDPAVAAISPNLGFLNDLPLSGGAKIFRGPDLPGIISQATRLSKERMKAYREGKYHPATHMMVWRRDQLLDWAARQG